jgi:hypothetical protein
MALDAFGEWQPRYAEIGIPTFPVRGKKPAVRGYLSLGLTGSSKLVQRFRDEPAFGLALKPAGITIVDVDTPDERVLADALARHGDTPFVVQSGSGNFQAWFQRQGEGRHIRPDPDTPIDILGDGFVVAPPSMGTKGPYRIVSGSLRDLATLPPLRNPPAGLRRRGAGADEGRRNDTLWAHLMPQARHCDDFAALLDVAETANGGYLPPLPEAEVLKTARSAWGYTERGENWFGRDKYAVATHEEIDELLIGHPDAFALLMLLRRRHWGRDFVLANAMAEGMPGGGWTRKRFAAARRDLEAAGKIELIQAAGKHHGPARYRLSGAGRSRLQQS